MAIFPLLSAREEDNAVRKGSQREVPKPRRVFVVREFSKIRGNEWYA
jgi:hypothetical protein